MVANLLSNTNGVEKKSYKGGYPGKLFTETTINGFFTVDRNWTVKYWNKAAEKLLKVTAKDILGKNLWEKFANVIPLDFYAVYHKAFLQDIPLHFEEYWGEMGSWFDVITYYCDDVLSVSFKSHSQPYSELQENTIGRLRSLTELYQFVTEITNDCLWEWDLLSREIFWIDGGHKRVFGYQIENALIPQSFWESRVHPDDKFRILNSLHKLSNKAPGKIWECEYRFKKADGEYAYVHDRGHIIYGEDKLACRMLGATQDITEKIMLEKELEEERLAVQREITDSVLIAEENERSSIGRKLHDNVNQILTVCKLYIELAQKDEEKREMLLTKSSELVMSAIEEIRKISKSIAVSDIQMLGLFSCIRRLLDELNIVKALKIKFKPSVFEEDIDGKVQLNIFRIIQEQVTNILKHSEATAGTIDLVRRKNNLVLLISDNGKGCDTSAKRTGVGLTNIMSRARIGNGTAVIYSKPGKGFKLKVILPVSQV